MSTLEHIELLPGAAAIGDLPSSTGSLPDAICQGMARMSMQETTEVRRPFLWRLAAGRLILASNS